MSMKLPDRTARQKQYLKQIGSNIRAARLQAKMSQEEFAAEAGFSRSYFTEIESGKRNISILNLIKIMELTGTGPELIVGRILPKKE